MKVKHGTMSVCGVIQIHRICVSRLFSGTKTQPKTQCISLPAGNISLINWLSLFIAIAKMF